MNLFSNQAKSQTSFGSSFNNQININVFDTDTALISQWS